LYETLSQYYPRNLLLRLEVGRTYEREGNRAAALEVYTQVVEQVEAGVPGYSKVPRERLYYQIGIMHLQMGELDQALSAFSHVGEREEGDGLVKAFSALRRGEIYVAQKQPERARAEFERVAAMPYEEPRQLAQQRLRALSR
jgi:tetratricopeptide (TPR) repeat protein